MALFDDLFKGGNIVAGLAIGAGASADPGAETPREVGDQSRARRLRARSCRSGRA